MFTNLRQTEIHLHAIQTNYTPTVLAFTQTNFKKEQNIRNYIKRIT